MGAEISKSSSAARGASSSSRPSSGAAPSRSAGAASQFRTIADQFQTIDQVQNALRQQGLESSSLIVAVDFTKSNEWTGKHSNGGRSLHALGATPNPYEMAITIVARTLAAFDDDGLIPTLGFGDASTQDQAVFSFFPGGAPAPSLNALNARYRELVPHVKLAGPTSFAPAIHEAMRIVAASGNQYHILVIVADGQVTRSSDMPANVLSTQEEATVRAIVAASALPLSIIMVGVGDGPWDVMREFDDRLPARKWDNFQFVNFTEVLQRYHGDPARLEAQFALNALMEIPEQFQTIQRMQMLSRRSNVNVPTRRPLEPPAPTYAPPPVAYTQTYAPPGSFSAYGAPPQPSYQSMPSFHATPSFGGGSYPGQVHPAYGRPQPTAQSFAYGQTAANAAAAAVAGGHQGGAAYGGQHQQQQQQGYGGPPQHPQAYGGPPQQQQPPTCTTTAVRTRLRSMPAATSPSSGSRR